MIEVSHLTKKYGDTAAVSDLSFRVEKGEIYGFLGPNGAGKSTTMNIITGYIAATEGEVSINGYDILRDAGKAKSMIGYLPEIPPLYTDMTVREYLMFAAELKGITRDERLAAVESAENTVQIGDVSARLIKNLSKGYRQRVGFAQAILGLPEVLILDEPTAGLDPKQIIEVRDLIRELGKSHTIILSSHILSEVSAVCDKIMIISHGKLVACDTPENLMELMHPMVTLKIQVKGDRQTVENVLSGLAGISSWKVGESAEDGVFTAEVQYEHGEEIRDVVAKAFAEAKCLVVGLSEESASLEDVFLELTESDQESAEQMADAAEKTENSVPEEESAEDEAAGDSDAEENVPEEKAQDSAEPDDTAESGSGEAGEEEKNESHI